MSAAVVLLASACGSAGQPVSRITQQQSVGPLTIELETPDRPPLLEEQEVVVAIRDQAGHPVEGAQVWLALMMPTMAMRSNEPDALPESDGRYRAKAIFTMSGTWTVEVHATVQGQEHIAIFRAQTA
jgi:hypothetical protein